MALSAAFNTAAANIEWQGTTADYNTPADWFGNVVPGPADNAINDNGSNNVVQINPGDPDWMLNQILAGDSTGNGALVQNGQVVSLAGTNLNGVVVTTYLTPFRLGVSPADTGVYTLNAGSLIYTTGAFNVGELGTGILNINGGAISGNGIFADNLGASALPTAVTATVGGGLAESDYTWFQQGDYAVNPSLGLPAPGTTITSVGLSDHIYTLPQSYTATDAVMLSSNVPNATITLASPMVCSNLSLVGSAGNGPVVVGYTVHHADGTTETGSISVPDWFGPAANTNMEVMGGIGARVNALGSTFQTVGTGTGLNGTAPYLFSLDIPLTNLTSAVDSIDLAYVSGSSLVSATCFLGISGQSPSGGNYVPLAMTGFNEDMIVGVGEVPQVANTITDIVNQVAGVVNLASSGQLFVGNAGQGIYNLSGGGIIVSNYIAIGRSGGTGIFNMTGGALNQDGNGNLLVGTGNNTPAGGSSSGVLNQSGGTITSLGQFLVPEESPCTSVYNLSGTGALVVNNWLAVGRQGGDGTINLNGGSITKGGDNTTHLDIGASAIGILNQTNGVITNLVSGTWIGESGSGTWNLEGGAAYLANVIICDTAAASGTLNLDGGLLQTTGITTVTNIAVSQLNLNGGILQASANNNKFISGLVLAFAGPNPAIIDSQDYTIAIPQEIDDNGGGLVKLGAGVLTLTGPNTYSGSTVVSNGTLIVATGGDPGNYIAEDNTAFGVLVQTANGQLNAQNVTLGNSTGVALDFNLDSFGNPASAPLNVGGTLTVNGTMTVNLTDADVQVGQIPLIQFGSINGVGNFVIGSLPPAVYGTIVTNGNTIALNITGVNQPVWEGEAGGTWDTGLDTNWVNLGTGLPTTYADPSAVIFNDSALGTTNVDLTATVHPASVIVNNNALSYTFYGSGSIAGTTGLNKQGTNSLSLLTGADSYTGPTVITAGTLIVTNLANGSLPSPIGASSANPTNLVLAGGTLSYQGAPVTVNRGYQMTAGSTIDAEGNLTLGGQAQATGSSAFIKTGPGTLDYTGAGSNWLSSASGGFSAQVLNGTLILDGSAGPQTNYAAGDMYIASGTVTGANLILTNTVLNCNAWFAIGRGNGTSGLLSTVSLYNSLLTCPSGLSLGYANGLSGYLATQVLTLSGNSQLISGGNVNICETANSGATSTVNVTGSSSLTGLTTYVGASTSHGVLNLASTGTNLLANGSGNTFRVGGNAASTDTGVGAINQSAGLFISGSNGVYLALGVGSATTYGSYNLSGGTMTRTTGFRVARGGLASFVQSGGTFNCGGEFSLASTPGFGASVAAATFTGGSTIVASGSGFRVPESSTFTAAVNIGTEAGGNASVVTLFSSGFQLCYGGTAGNGTLNLDSGTLQLGGPISRVAGSGTGTVNLDGGTAQAGVNNITLIDTTPSSVNVFKGGLIVDTMINTAAISGNLLTTPGNGIYPTGGLLLISTNGGSGYIGSPLVSVTGGSGSGAMAVATVSNGVVTNLLITCPGRNYQAGDVLTFAFAGGGATAVASNFVYTLQAGDIAPNAGGGLTKIGFGTLYLNGANTYTGTNLVNAGTLAGSGSVAGAVTVASGGTLAVGSSPSSIGTFTISGPLTFLPGSTNFMKINKTAATKDLLTGMSQVTYGGTLIVSNLSGTLANGDSFKLFNAASYNGSFSAILPATPGLGLSWNTSQLAVSGTLSVANGVNANPTNVTFSVSGRNLNLSWPSDHLGWRLQVQTNSLAVGISTNWSTWPNSTNVTSVSLPIVPGNPTEFFRLVYP